MHIFRCKHTKLWVLPLKGDKEKRPFSEPALSSRCCFPRQLHLAVSLPHHLPIARPSHRIYFTAGSPKASFFICFGLHWSVPLPTSVPLVGTVNLQGLALISLRDFLSTLSSVAFLAPSVRPHRFWPGRRARLSDGVCASWALGSLGVQKQQWVWGGQIPQASPLPPLQGLLRGRQEAPLFWQRPFCYISLKLTFMKCRHHAKPRRHTHSHTPLSLTHIVYFQNNPITLALSSSFLRTGKSRHKEMR